MCVVAGGGVSSKSLHWKKSKVSLGNLERRLSQIRKEKEDADCTSIAEHLSARTRSKTQSQVQKERQ